MPDTIIRPGGEGKARLTKIQGNKSSPTRTTLAFFMTMVIAIKFGQLATVWILTSQKRTPWK